MANKEKTALGHVVKKTRKVKPKIWKTAQSLRPNTQFMDLLLLPKPTERVLAMQEAWKFNEPVRYATQEEVDSVEWDTFGQFDDHSDDDTLLFPQMSAREIRNIVLSFKQACSRCGETFPEALEFHHRDPSEKLFNIANFYGEHRRKENPRSGRELIEEISKCDVLCASCHRKEEYGKGIV